MTAPRRPPAPSAPPRPLSPTRSARPARPARPDATPSRAVVGILGLASATALVTAMLPSVTPAAAVDAAGIDVPGTTSAVEPTPSVTHVTRYVTLAPGQTAPPQATVVVRPTPSPKVRTKVVTRTRQSGG